MALQEQHVSTRDNLFTHHNFPIKTASMTVAQAGLVLRGTLLDDKGAIAGASAQPVAVLAEDVDTTAGAVVAPVYLTGEFNEAALIVADGATVEGLKAKARMACIFIEKTI